MKIILKAKIEIDTFLSAYLCYHKYIKKERSGTYDTPNAGK